MSERDAIVQEIGSEVFIGPIGDRTTVAQVIGIALYGKPPARRIMYLVSYWSGSTRNEHWLDEFEIAPAVADERFQLGYVTE